MDIGSVAKEDPSEKTEGIRQHTVDTFSLAAESGAMRCGDMAQLVCIDPISPFSSVTRCVGIVLVGQSIILVDSLSHRVRTVTRA